MVPSSWDSPVFASKTLSAVDVMPLSITAQRLWAKIARLLSRRRYLGTR
jgi:hypothetical protein